MNFDEVVKLISGNIISFLIYAKLIKKTWIKNTVFDFIIFVCAYTISILSLRNHITEPYKSLLIVVAVTFAFYFFKRGKLQNIFINMFLSIGFMQTMYISSVILSAIVCDVAGLYGSNPIISTLNTFNQSIMLFCFIKADIKFTHNRKRSIGSIGLILSGLIFVIYGLSRKEAIFFIVPIDLLIGLVFCIIGVVYWIKRETVIFINNNFQKTIISDQNDQLQILEKSNDHLSSRVHKDNHILNAYQDAVELLVNESDSNSLKNKADQMLQGLKENAKDDYQAFEKQSSDFLKKTGYSLLDEIMKYMYQKATRAGIDFQLCIAGDPQEIEESISITKFNVLITYLIDNALISCKTSITKKVLIKINTQNILLLSVFDSGIAFKEEILKKLGKEKTTTHADRGGSGIGYMTIFEIIREAEASLYISQHPNQTDTYGKAVEIKFDGKGNYIYRNNVDIAGII